MKYQFASRNPVIAHTNAGTNPPSAATTTTTSRNISRSLGSVSVPRTFARTRVSSGGTTMARIQASIRRRGETATPSGGGGAHRPLPASVPWSSTSEEMTWTSMVSDARMTLLITEPRRRCVHRDWRLAPSTICVAFSFCANCTSVVAGSALASSWYSPPSSWSSVRCAPSASPEGPRSPSDGRTCTPRSSPRVRAAMRAARRMTSSPPGAPVIATTTRSRVSHGRAIPWASR